MYFLTRSGSVHCGSLIALGFGTNPFLTRLRSLKRKTTSFFVHALAHGQDGIVPSCLRSIVPLQNTLCLQTDVFFSGTDDDMVEELNTDDASDLDKPFRHLDVFP